MALVRTTLSSAVLVTDNVIVVASATSILPGRIVLVDQEEMQVGQGYISGTTIPVLRGRNGSATAAHVVTAGVVHGLASDFDLPVPQLPTTYAVSRGRVVTSITATSTLTLPAAGSDIDVVLNGTSVIALTIPVPTVDMDTTRLTIMANGVAAHTLTFTGGLSGAGGSYDIITVNATAPSAYQFVACNALWLAICGPAISGTTTNIAGAIA